MNVIEEYVNTLRGQIRVIGRLEHLTENEKYKEICADYASIMTALSQNHNNFSLKDLLPITNVFMKYQKEYFAEDA